MGNRLLAAGPDGCAQLYSINVAELDIGRAGLDHLKEISFDDTPLSGLVVSAPGSMIQSVRINHTEFQPTAIIPASTDSPQRVIAAQRNNLYHYDLQTAKVIAAESVNTI